MKILILFSLAFILTATIQAAEHRKPNILFILADDQSPFDFKFHNPQSTLESPNIDRLATSGMIFDSAYHMGSFSGAVFNRAGYATRETQLFNLKENPHELLAEHHDPKVTVLAGTSPAKQCEMRVMHRVRAIFLWPGFRGGLTSSVSPLGPADDFDQDAERRAGCQGGNHAGFETLHRHP
jgi:hypothetical protein